MKCHEISIRIWHCRRATQHDILCMCDSYLSVSKSELWSGARCSSPAFLTSDRCAGISATTGDRDSRRPVRVFFAQYRASRQHDGSTIGAVRATLDHGRTWRRTELLAWNATGSEGFGLSFGSTVKNCNSMRWCQRPDWRRLDQFIVPRLVPVIINTLPLLTILKCLRLKSLLRAT